MADRATGRAWVLWVSVASTVGLAMLHLPYPFHGDQAFTFVAAHALDRGATLYVDVWDIRQPGGIWFFWVAGRLFGFSEFGIHLLEILWMAITGAVVFAIARKLVSRSYLAYLAPLLTVGQYYAHARPWELTQPEALVMLPLAICLLVAISDGTYAERTGAIRRWLVFGIAAGAVVIFKLLLITIPVTLAAVCATLAVVRREATVRDVVTRGLLPAFCGLLLALLPVVAHFWGRGALGPLYWTTFVAPALSIAQLPRAPYHRLATSAGWFLRTWLPAVPLLWFGTWVRPHTKGVLLVLAWVAAAAGAILLQRVQYWPYHFLLFVVPLGLLTVKGADAALDWLAPAAGTESLGLALLLLPVLLAIGPPAASKALALRRAARFSAHAGDAYRRAMSATYAPSRAAAAAISGAGAKPGRVFVFGSPEILVYANRAQAIPLRGWARPLLLEAQWAAFGSMLKAARPVYIFVADGSDMERTPGTVTLLAERYRPFWKGAAGDWYEIKEDLAPR